MSEPIRFPLQTGESSLARLVWGGAWLFVAVRCLKLIVDPTSSWFALSVPLGTAGVFLFVFATVRLRRGVAQRGSDLLIDDRGVTVEGGALAGRGVLWREIDRAKTELLETSQDAFQHKRATRADTSKLMLALGDGDVLLLAEAQTDDERASLRALAASLQSPAWTPGERAAPAVRDAPSAEGTARVLACPSCGAEVAPADRDAVTCAHCGGACPIDADTRERMRAMARNAEQREALDRAVREWLDQPKATTINRGLLAVGLAVPIGLEVATWFWRVGVTLVVVSALVAIVVHAHRRIARRRAARTVIRDFAAHGPRQAGAPARCRRCLGPLPQPEHGCVVECVYCGAHNVLGVDLRREQREDASRARDLASELEARRAAERTYLSAFAIAASAALFGVVLLAMRGR